MEWIKYSWENKESRPPRAGRYLIYRAKCDKMHFEQWNGTGWSSSNNDCTHWSKPKKPIIEKTQAREQFKEMVTYLMEEGTDNSIIEGYVDTFMLIHNESKMAKRIKELEEEKDKWLSMYYEASTNLDIQAEKLMENKKRIEGLSKFIMNMNLFEEYFKWKDTEL
jgi:methionine synthase I (cobalamin-dependent)